MIRKSLKSCVSVILMGLGYSMFKNLNIGLDPFNSLVVSLSNKMRLGIGITQLLLNIGISMIVIRSLKEYIGIGSVFNMVFLGYFIQFFDLLFKRTPIRFNVGILLVSLLLISFSIHLYVKSDAGIAPFDILVKNTSQFFKIKFSHARIIMDVLFLIITAILRGPIGIGTIILVLAVGPCIGLFENISESYNLK